MKKENSENSQAKKNLKKQANIKDGIKYRLMKKTKLYLLQTQMFLWMLAASQKDMVQNLLHRR